MIIIGLIVLAVLFYEMQKRAKEREEAATNRLEVFVAGSEENTWGCFKELAIWGIAALLFLAFAGGNLLPPP